MDKSTWLGCPQGLASLGLDFHNFSRSFFGDVDLTRVLQLFETRCGRVYIQHVAIVEEQSAYPHGRQAPADLPRPQLKALSTPESKTYNLPFRSTHGPSPAAMAVSSTL